MDSDAGPLWLPSADGVMLQFLQTYGNWEPEEAALLLSLARPGGRFLDIGASVGYFSCLLAGRVPGLRVDAFEPHPQICRLLALNTWAHNDRVTVWPLALGARTDTVALTTADHNVGDTRSWGSDDDAVMLASQARLDDLIDGPVDLVKIDVQGYETDIISGMTRIIEESPSIQLVVEFWPDVIYQRGLTPEGVLAFYRDAGLSVSLVGPSGPAAADDDDVITYAESGGPGGQADLLLRATAR